ncbi:dickkopf-related protein 2-like [Girardinichthys multiradiatus]|uniref:dickkopf-related protein 2-like n=1 Tax=Girardinichthys multiradiatus TaxID=208333 RepID=UPI001FABBECB|nr:dickkopf-related protein 2-like [Girardinichthys multiradiatus]
MSLRLVLMMSAGVALVACARREAARVRLNSIRTVILRESHELPVNRTAWGPGMDLTLYQCMSDLECIEGNYCHIPTKGFAHSRCQTCRRRNRHCQRDSMCCPGNRCNTNICVPDVDTFLSRGVLDNDGKINPSSKKGLRGKGRVSFKGTSGQVGNPCLRSSDCSDSLCCARHFWTRICKPVLQEGQVCTRQRRKGHQGSELFQRCSCGEGLTCRTVHDPNDRTPPPSSTLLPNEAINSKSAASPSLSRHSSPHTSVLSTASSSALGKSSAVVVKTRLHMCQRK